MTYTTHLPDRHRNDAWKVPVRAASTANGTLATAFENGDTLDGVVLATGDRILLKNQAAGAENGVYTVNPSGAPTRAADFDTQGDILAAVVVVTNGTVNADTMWLCTTNTPIVVGSTALVFASAGGGASGAAGGVLSGTYPNPGFAADMATQAELDAHTGDTTDAHDASAVSVLDTGGNFTGTDVEAVLAELVAAGGLHAASHEDGGSDEIDVTGLTGAGGAFRGALAYNDGAQVIGTSSVTALTFAAESYDTDTLHSTSSNTSRITIPTGMDGKWRFAFHTTLRSGNNTTGIRAIWLRKNGTTDVIGSELLFQPLLNQQFSGTVTVDCALVATDYVEVVVFQSSGGNLSFGDTLVNGPGHVNSLSAQFLGA